MPPTTKKGLEERFYMLGDSGFERVTLKREPIASVDQQLKLLASETLTTFPRLFKVGDSTVHMVALPSRMCLVTRLSQMRMSTYYVVRPPVRRGPPRLAPVFDSGAGATRLAPIWKPLDNMALWFIMSFLPTGTNKLWYYGEAYLTITALDKTVKGTFKPPLPNIHPNAKLCLGVDRARIQPGEGTPLAEVFANGLNTFQGNHWNADLLGSNDQVLLENMFSFNAEDNATQLPGPTDWATKLVKVSNAEFNYVPFGELT